MGVMGRPVSSGSLTDSEGGVRTYLHANRLDKLAEKYGGRDGELMRCAAAAMRLMAKKNRAMGRKVGSHMAAELAGRGLSIPRDEAAERIAELAADGEVTVYIGREPNRVRVMRNGRLPRGAKLIGTYDAGCDFRHIAEDLAA